MKQSEEPLQEHPSGRLDVSSQRQSLENLIPNSFAACSINEVLDPSHCLLFPTQNFSTRLIAQDFDVHMDLVCGRLRKIFS